MGLLYDIIKVMKRRLFIALTLPEKAENELLSEIDAVKGRFGSYARYTPKENLHVTVLFLGEQEEHDIAVIQDAMDEVLQSYPHQTVSFDALTFGPPRHEPRMIWATATQSTSDYLGHLRDALAYHLRKRGIVWNDDHPIFRGHITCAKFRSWFEGLSTPFRTTIAISAETYELGLFSSTLDSEGSIYTTLYNVKCE